ncbi:uncharacterized protein CG1161 isoform X2 [Bemisia tabaci]|uniref:uncharacterized protein CG1161 isoform X2 n=1 Tax=Bemisia tabaci TaxID=7038 RepID=UPI0008F9CC6A|nr:PREDICTED: uncharacterized protein CG1161 isoform X2 [Bemisia tabaci]
MSLSFHQLFVFGVILLSCVLYVQGQSYEDARCKCVCTYKNGTRLVKKLRVTSVPLSNDCDEVAGPVEEIVHGNTTQEMCSRCECTYESRNTNIIKFVVIIVIWVISLLVIYMLFLICLDPLLNKRVKGNYVEHTNDDDDISSSSQAPGTSHPMGMRGSNVLNRVGHQQDKWKRQVQEQRKNIYDRHTMLN